MGGQTVTDVWERLQYGLREVTGILPAVLAAGLIFLAGYFLARQLQRWADRTLQQVDFNRLAHERGLDEVMTRGGSRDPVRTVAGLLFWLVMLVVILLASAALGLDSVNRVLGQILGLIPSILAAIIIVILGMVLGEFVRAVILASAGTVSGVPTLAKIAKGGVVLVATLMALQQVGVPDEILTTGFTLVLGAIALAAGLAFGLGNRELAGEVTRRWYEAGRMRGRRREDQARVHEDPT
jgi:small-conductance mechanosensitive channel